MKENKNYIEQSIYSTILQHVPLVCLDLLIYSPKRNQFLLIRRNQEPLKGNLYFPGGRLYKHEKLEEACLRIAKNETGLDCVYKRFLGVYETDFSNSSVEGIGTHTINLTYFLTTLNDEVVLDSTSDEYVWVSVNGVWPEELNENLRNFIDQVFFEN